jgi:hypothetical protein
MLKRVLPRGQRRPTMWMVGVVFVSGIPQWLMAIQVAYAYKVLVGVFLGALVTWVATRNGRPRAVVGFTAIWSTGLAIEGFAAHLLSQGSNGLGLDAALDAAVTAGRSDYYTALLVGVALGVAVSAWLVARIDRRHGERISALFASHPSVIELARARREAYRLGIWCAMLPLLFGLQNVVRLSLRFPLPGFEISGVGVFTAIDAVFLVVASVLIYISVRRWGAPRGLWLPLVVGWLLASLMAGVWAVVFTCLTVLPLLGAVWLATREPKAAGDEAIRERLAT